MKKYIRDFLRDESGQTSTEYILLIAVVGFIIFKFKSVLEEKLLGANGKKGIADSVFNKAQELIDTM